MNIPKKILNSPIIEAVAEIRFENEFPSVVLFGKLYSALSRQFSKVEALPILEMPSEVINTQPNLRYSIHYRLKNDKFIIGIGQRVVAINRICTNVEYDSWNEYYTVIKDVLKEVERTELLSTITRVSVRYMNLFQGDVDVENILNLKVNFLGSDSKDHNDLGISFNKKIDDSSKLGIGISVNAKIDSAGFSRKGILFNIEAYNDIEMPMSEVVAKIDVLHNIVGEGFFKALTPEFLESVKPTYEQ